MTRPTAVWLKHGKAKVFEFEDDLTLWSVNSIEIDDKKHLFSALASRLGKAGGLLLLGPDVSKYQFRTHLAEHHPLIACHIAGCEAYGQEPDGQIATWAKRYWEKVLAVAV